MGFLTIMLTFLSTIAMNLVAQHLYDSSPRLSRYLLNWATRRLPKETRDRYAEEWASHAADDLGKLAGLHHALGCVVASYRMIPPLLLTRGHHLVAFFVLEKYGFWALGRRARRIEARTHLLETQRIGDEAELRRDLDRFLKLTVDLHIIKIGRTKLWQGIRDLPDA